MNLGNLKGTRSQKEGSNKIFIIFQPINLDKKKRHEPQSLTLSVEFKCVVLVPN